MFLDDSHLGKSLFSNVCNKCRHFKPESAFTETKICRAFPDGIPVAIWSGENKHLVPFPGDSGIVFEAINKDAAI